MTESEMELWQDEVFNERRYAAGPEGTVVTREVQKAVTFSIAVFAGDELLSVRESQIVDRGRRSFWDEVENSFMPLQEF